VLALLKSKRTLYTSNIQQYWVNVHFPKWRNKEIWRKNGTKTIANPRRENIKLCISMFSIQGKWWHVWALKGLSSPTPYSITLCSPPGHSPGLSPLLQVAFLGRYSMFVVYLNSWSLTCMLNFILIPSDTNPFRECLCRSWPYTHCLASQCFLWNLDRYLYESRTFGFYLPAKLAHDWPQVLPPAQWLGPSWTMVAVAFDVWAAVHSEMNTVKTAS
jgi:hypothetical protein